MEGVTVHATQPAIHEVETALELQIANKDDVQETLLSRRGDGPLIERATAIRSTLLEGGWTDVGRSNL
jgi:hypothetical protein